jgi:hypothetical protein
MDFLYFISIFGFAALGIWVLFSSRDLIRQALASYRWMDTEGTIIDSSDDSFIAPGIDRTSTGIVPVTYKETAHVYEYHVEGRTYHCSTYCFGAHVDLAEAAFLIGSKVRVYYDPRDPRRAVLKRGLLPTMFMGPALLAAAIYMAVDLFFRK